MCVLSKTQEGVCHMVQEASKIPNGEKEAVQTSSIDAANAAQFVRHLEEDPLIQRKQDAGGLSMMDAHSDNLTCGSGACAPSKTLEHLQLPVMNRGHASQDHGDPLGQLGGAVQDPIITLLSLTTCNQEG